MDHKWIVLYQVNTDVSVGRCPVTADLERLPSIFDGRLFVPSKSQLEAKSLVTETVAPVATACIRKLSGRARVLRILEASARCLAGGKHANPLEPWRQ